MACNRFSDAIPGPVWVFLTSTFVGVVCMSPGLNVGDSGELIAAAATLSIAHAPGYPLMALLGHALGTLLPLGAWAFRVNLVSVLCSGAALGLYWDAMRRCGSTRLGAAAGTAFLGLSPLWLHTSLQTEVFALNGLCAVAALWIYCRYAGEFYDPRPMAALGLILGLGGANHHTLILIVPALLAAGVISARPDFDRFLGGLARLLGFGLLGLAVYLYLPIRSRMNPPLDWGHPVDLGSFLHVLLRRDYGSFSLTVEGAQSGRFSGIVSQSGRYLASLYTGFGPAGCILAGLGIWARSARSGALAPILWVLLSGPVFLWMGNPPFDPQTTGALERFHLLSWIGVAWLVSYGAVWIQHRDRWGRPAASALLLIPILSAVTNSAHWNQRWDLTAHDYGRNLLRSLPPGSAFFIDGGDDSFYTTAYNQFAESRRPDVETHDRGGLVFPNPYGGDFRKIARERKEERRLKIEGEMARRRPLFYSTLRDKIDPMRSLGAWGLVRRAHDAESRRDLWAFYVRRYSPENARAHYRVRALLPIYDVLRAAEDRERRRLPEALMRLRAAGALAPDVAWVTDQCVKHGQWVGFYAAEMRNWALAEMAYLFVLERRPEDVALWLNLGVALERQDRLGETEAAYRHALRLSPDSVQAYFNLGSLFWKRADWNRAAEMFESAQRLEPKNLSVQRYAQQARLNARGAK